MEKSMRRALSLTPRFSAVTSARLVVFPSPPWWRGSGCTAIELRQLEIDANEISPSLPRSGGEGRGEEDLKSLEKPLSPLRREREKIPNRPVDRLNSTAVGSG